MELIGLVGWVGPTKAYKNPNGQNIFHQLKKIVYRTTSLSISITMPPKSAKKSKYLRFEKISLRRKKTSTFFENIICACEEIFTSTYNIPINLYRFIDL